MALLLILPAFAGNLGIYVLPRGAQALSEVMYHWSMVAFLGQDLSRHLRHEQVHAGLSHVALRLTSWDQRDQLTRFLTEVAPAFTPHAQGRSRS